MKLRQMEIWLIRLMNGAELVQPEISWQIKNIFYVNEVVTPFKLTSGEVITVVRGWTPAAKSALDTPKLNPAPEQQLEINGRLRLFNIRDLTEPSDLPIGQRIGINPEYGLAYLELTSTNPDISSDEITYLPPPALTEGPHRSYAIQWLIFIAMLIGGYLILLRNDLVNRSKLPTV
jgi:cytochrome oxidase assembly protein ShyY1